jgi:hypothetical protein
MARKDEGGGIERGGAEGGPTARAARDQQARHRAEGSTGRIASRTPGKQAATRDEQATGGRGRRAASTNGRRASPVIPHGKAASTRSRTSASGKLSQTAGGPMTTAKARAQKPTRPKRSGKTGRGQR